LARPIGKKKTVVRYQFYLDDEDVSWKIRESEIGEGSSVIAVHPEVRKVFSETPARYV